MTGKPHAGIGVWIALLASAAPGWAGVEFNGAIATENYLRTGGDDHQGEFLNFRNANLVRLKIKAVLSDNVHAFADLELRNTNFTQVHTVGDLWDRGSIDPISWRINEAYVDLYGFLLDFDGLTLDLRAGKQNIAWGEADGFNPTNNFDPYNLENPLDFKEHIGNVALKATLNIGEDLFTLEGVVAPRFLPAVLPLELFLGDDPFKSPLMPAIDPATLQALQALNIDLVSPSSQVITAEAPAMVIGNVMAGARLKGSLLGYEWTLSYFHGRDSLPAPASVKTTLASTQADGCPNPGRSCVLINNVNLLYPQIDVLGADLRGSIGQVGVWGEVGVFFPRKLPTTVSIPLFPDSVVPGIDDTPYTKWTLGADYTISGGYYLNLQWVHGFFTERTGHALHDYLFLIFRKSVLSDRLKFELTLGGELDTTRGRHAKGGIGNVQVAYKPFDGAEVVLGYVITRAEDGATLKLFEPLDQVYLKIRADF